MLDRLRLRLIITLATAVGLAVPVSAGDSHGHGAPAHDATPDAKPAAKTDVAPAAAGHGETSSVSADDAIKMLMDGNDRFVAGTPSRPHQTAARLCETFTGGQHPYAAVLSCADSRVPVELVFDAGIGDLFVVRVAGNVADVDEVGTIEYGVEHLGITAIAVIGHVKCGAVTAVVDGAHVTPNIAKLVDNIAPAANEARQASPQVTGAKLVARAIRTNVRYATAELTGRSPLLKKYVDSGKLKIVGGVYDLHTGQVDWLEQSEKPLASAQASRTEGRAVADEHDTKPAPAAHSAPAAHDEHGSDAKAPAKHGPHSNADTDHSDAADKDEHTAAKPASPVKKDNFWALGGCIAGASVVSFGVMHFLKGNRPAAAVPVVEAPAAVEASPAAPTPAAEPATPAPASEPTA